MFDLFEIMNDFKTKCKWKKPKLIRNQNNLYDDYTVYVYVLMTD